MKIQLVLLLLLPNLISLATAQTCAQLGDAAISAAYNDSEFRTYICPDEKECSSVEDFSKFTDLNAADLNLAVPKFRRCSFFVTPKSKGKQFPTLVYVSSGETVTQALSDYENGLSISKVGRKGMRDLISRTHPLADHLIKTTYGWDGQKYSVLKTACFKVLAKDGGRSAKLIPETCK